MAFKVGDEFRTSDKSRMPGGVTVVVVYKDGKKREYDKVKNSGAYIKTVLKNPDVKEAYVKEEGSIKKEIKEDDLPF